MKQCCVKAETPLPVVEVVQTAVSSYSPGHYYHHSGLLLKALVSRMMWLEEGAGVDH